MRSVLRFTLSTNNNVVRIRCVLEAPDYDGLDRSVSSEPSHSCVDVDLFGNEMLSRAEREKYTE